MRKVRCPGCGRGTDKLELTGICEHCGQSALTAEAPTYVGTGHKVGAYESGGKTTITLFGRDGRAHESLPLLCLRCGGPMCEIKEKKFGWFPPWIHLLAATGLPFLIALMLSRKMMTVKIPLCRRHRRPWLGLQLFAAFVLVYFLVLPWLLIFLSVEAEKAWGRGNPWSGALLLGWLIGLPILIVLLFLIKRRTIYVKKITLDSITLGGVSELIADKLAHVRR